MKKLLKQYISFILVLTTLFLNAVLLLHKHYENDKFVEQHYEKKQHHQKTEHKNNCVICIIINYLSNVALVEKTIFFSLRNFLTVLILISFKQIVLQKIPFLNRAPPKI